MTADTFDTEATRKAIDALVEETLGRRPSPPPRVWITDKVVKDKHPDADLKLRYRRGVWGSVAFTLALHVSVAVAFPEFEFRRMTVRRVQSIIAMEDIPETRQIQRPPPPPRPAVPIETESTDVPDDVTIESTDLDFDEAPLDLPPPPGSREATDAVEEEIIEFWAVQEPPRLVREVFPAYPEVARKAGLEGTVFLQFVVGVDGKVRAVSVLKGPEIFRSAAVAAVQQFVFAPALQNDNPAQVRMTRPIRFRLADGG